FSSSFRDKFTNAFAWDALAAINTIEAINATARKPIPKLERPEACAKFCKGHVIEGNRFGESTRFGSDRCKNAKTFSTTTLVLTGSVAPKNVTAAPKAASIAT